MTHLKKIITNLTAPIDTELGLLNNVPNFVIKLSIFMSINAIFQAIADIILEILILMSFVPIKIPFRLEFLFLTLISTVIAYLTLRGLREGNLDVTKNTLLIGLLVETSLVLADIYLLATTDENILGVLGLRLMFIILTSSNISIITYIIWNNLRTKQRRPHYRF